MNPEICTRDIVIHVHWGVCMKFASAVALLKQELEFMQASGVSRRLSKVR